MSEDSFPEAPRPNLGGEQPEEKFVMMPKREEMAKKLQQKTRIIINDVST